MPGNKSSTPFPRPCAVDASSRTHDQEAAEPKAVVAAQVTASQVPAGTGADLNGAASSEKQAEPTLANAALTDNGKATPEAAGGAAPLLAAPDKPLPATPPSAAAAPPVEAMRAPPSAAATPPVEATKALPGAAAAPSVEAVKAPPAAVDLPGPASQEQASSPLKRPAAQATLPDTAHGEKRVKLSSMPGTNSVRSKPQPAVAAAEAHVANKKDADGIASPGDTALSQRKK